MKLRTWRHKPLTNWAFLAPFAPRFIGVHYHARLHPSTRRPLRGSGLYHTMPRTATYRKGDTFIHVLTPTRGPLALRQHVRQARRANLRAQSERIARERVELLGRLGLVD